MHYTAKFSPSHVALRKAARALLAGPVYPAWQDGDGEGATFPMALLPQLRTKLVRNAAGQNLSRRQPHESGEL